MATPNDGYSRQSIPLQSGGAAPPSRFATNVPPSNAGAGQDYVRSPVPLESPVPTGDGTPQTQTGAGTMDYLGLARENYRISRNYFDIAIRRRVEDTLSHAFSRHAGGSKYHNPEFDKRSKFFRPKTRAMMRQQEAACAIAFFSTQDVTSCQAVDPTDKQQVLAAAIHTQLLNYQFQTTVPIFKLVLGGLFDAMTQGVVISCQEWKYREVTATYDEFGADGKPTGGSKTTTKVVEDTPSSRLIPIENLMLHPSCDWLDPIGSSPFLIETIPFHVNELAERIAKARSFGSNMDYIKEFTEQELLAGSSDQDTTANSLRMQREALRLDRMSQVNQGSKFRTVWVHRHIVRIDGEDLVYETLGTTMLLSNPVPLADVYGLDERPYALGSMTIESHRPYPSGPGEMVKQTQEVMNEFQNLRIDNLRLVLNNRFLVKRGQMVDMRSLLRNVPGAVTLTTDPSNDVKQLETKDVTTTAYQEQDRLNLDFDSLAGVFSQSTIGAARNFNERVRGMELMGQNADLVTELGLRTLCETWFKKALSQFVKLNSKFMNDPTILAIVGTMAQAQAPAPQQQANAQAPEQPQATWEQAFHLLTKPVRVICAVGFGNTDPMMRIQRITTGLQTVQQVAPEIAAGADQTAIVREIMGALGYADGSLFFPMMRGGQQDPQIAQLQQKIQELQSQLQSEQAKYDSAEKIAQIKANTQVQIANIKAKNSHDIALGKQAATQFVAERRAQIDLINQQIQRESNVIKQGQLLLEREALSNSIEQADREFELQLMQAAQPQRASDVALPKTDEPFIQSLRGPERGAMTAAVEHPHPGKQPKLNGADPAGAIERSGHVAPVPVH